MSTYPAPRISRLWPIGTSLFFTALITLTFYALIESSKTNEREDTNRALASIGQLKTRQIQSYLEERKADAAVLSNFLAAPQMQHWLSRRNERTPAALSQLADSATSAYRYRGIMVLDAEARVRFGTHGSGMLTDAGRTIALSTIREHAPAYFHIYFGDPATPEIPVLDIFVPVARTGGTEIVGMVVLRSELDFLFQLIQTWPAMSRTAESLLVTRDGDDVLFLNELRFKKNTALKFRIPINAKTSAQNIPTVEMLRKGRLGLIEGIDYRNQPTLGYNIAVPETSWGMVVKIDVDEAIEHSLRMQRIGVIVASAFILLLGIIVWLWWRKEKADWLANRQLQEAENKYRRLHESMMEAFVMVDMSGRLIEFNKAYQEMLGYSAEELHRLTYADLTPEKWLEAEAQIVRDQIIPRGYSQVYEKEYIRRDGTTFPVELKTFLLRDEDGQAEAMWAIARDITDRKQAEEELHRFFDLIPDLACIASTAGHFLKINSSWQSLLGYTGQELLATPFMDLIHPDDREATLKEMEQQIGGKATISFVNRYRCKDGSYKWLEWKTTPAIDETLLYATARDITERREAEALLKKSADEIADLYNHAPCGYHSLDKDGNIRLMNDTELAWLGYTREELIGKISWPDLLTPESQQFFRENFPKFLEQGFTHDAEIEIVRKDGSTFTGLVNSSAVYDPAGNFVMSRSTVVDITERKRAARQLQELSAHLQTIREDEKTRIAREIHDDLGGVLAALKMDIFRLKKELSAGNATTQVLERIGSMSQMLDGAVGALRRIISDLRPAILDDLGLLAALEWQAEQFQSRTGISCRVNCIDDTCAPNDRHTIALYRIFQEALTNVARHSGASRVEVEFQCNEEEIMLSINDNGRGLPEGHAAGPASFGIRGMREHTEQLGGRLEFGKSPSGGSSVTVRLPLTATNEERM